MWEDAGGGVRFIGETTMIWCRLCRTELFKFTSSTYDNLMDFFVCVLSNDSDLFWLMSI